MANEYTPTQLAAHIRKVWSNEIKLVASEEQVLAPDADELEKIEGQLVMRKFGNLGANTLGDSSAGLSLTASGNTEVVVSVTPVTKYVMTITNLNTIARCAFDPQVPLRKQIQASLFEQVDQTIAALATGFSTNQSGAADALWSDSLVREAKRKLITSAKNAYKVNDQKFVCVFHPNGFDDIDGIEAFYRADIRGDAENPLVNGAVYLARGGYWKESGNIQVDTATRNLLYIPKQTFGLGFNKEYAVKMEEFELVYKLIGWVDFGAMEIFDEYGVLVNTSPTA